MRMLLSKRTDRIPAGAMNIGRPSIFGNPYTHIADRKTRAEFVVSTREEAVSKYREYFYKRIEQDPAFKNAVMALKGRFIWCWCYPLLCHGSVILEYLQASQK